MDKKKTAGIIIGVIVCLVVAFFLVTDRQDDDFSVEISQNPTATNSSEQNLNSSSSSANIQKDHLDNVTDVNDESKLLNRSANEEKQDLLSEKLGKELLEFILVGHVFDPEGEPVSDSEIILQQTGKLLPAGYGVFSSAEVPLVFDLRTLQTDADGFYSTRLTEKLPLQLRALSPGFPDSISIIDQDGLITSGTLENQVLLRHDVSFDMGRIAAFQVVDQHDTFLENVKVEYMMKQSIFSTRSDESGYFELNLPQDTSSVIMNLEYGKISKKNYQMRLQDGVQKIVLPVNQGSIEGTVVRAGSGESVAHAVVELNSALPENMRNIFPLRYQTTTDGDGRFRFENLVSNRWLVSATSSGLHEGEMETYGSELLTLGEEERKQDVVIELPDSMPTWKVRVFEDKTNRPVEGAWFTSMHDIAYPEALVNLRSGADGSFDLSNLVMTDQQFWYFLTESYVNADGYEKKLVMPSGEQSIRKKAVENKSLDMKMNKGTEIHVYGTIRDAKGKPVAGAIVKDFDDLDDHLLQSDGIDVTDADGFYSLKLLKAHNFVLQITHRDFARNYSHVIDVDMEQIEYNHTMYSGGDVKVIVTGPEGNPLESTTVKIYDNWRLNYGQKKGAFDSKVTDESGEVLFRNWQTTDGVKPQGVTNNKTTVYIYHSEFEGTRESDFEIKEGGTAELIFQLNEKDTSGFIDGYILDENGNALEGAKVVLYNMSLNQFFEIQTDALGFFRFEDVASANYGVSASYSGYYPRTEFVDLPATEFELMLTPWPDGIKH